MSEGFRELLVEIAHCPIVKSIRSGECPISSPCKKIVGSQTSASFQLPEPWSGQINAAPILFVSSNPSIDELEQYPDESWEPERTVDFFNNRFSSAAGWTEDGIYALRRDGSRSPWVRFWASSRRRASEILERKKNNILPGIDFALTEVVHCKSRNEDGVEEALDFCSERYLERILSISAAKILIVYGKRAESAIRRCFGSSLQELPNNLSSIVIGGNLRILVFLPHPNKRGSKKTLQANIGDAGISLLREHLR